MGKNDDTVQTGKFPNKVLKEAYAEFKYAESQRLGMD